MRGVRLLAVALSVAAYAGVCRADEPPKGNPGDVNRSFCNGFFNVSCGLLAGPVFNVGRHTATSAEVVNNVVRINKDRDITLGVMGDIHHYFIDTDSVSYGIFFGLGAPANGGDTASFALGGIAGFAPGKHDKYPFSVGLGIVFTPGVQTLGDGMTENKPLPAGETQVRYKDVTGTGVFLGFGVDF